MFQKEGSSTIGGKKDAPLRKSDRRRLRDRVVDALFVNGDGSKKIAENEEWIMRAEKLIDDAIIAPKGDTLSRKLKLPTGEHATLFLRTPSDPADSALSPSTTSNGKSPCDDVAKSFPTVWPYHQSTQPIMLEFEDADRKVHLAPLLPLLAALPPPLSSPPLEDSIPCQMVESANAQKSETSDTTKYRMPNIIVHPAVSKYICRGADLMKSGIRSFPPPWTLRQSKGLVTISIIGNPQPVAVGIVENGLFREYCYSKNGNPGGRANWRAEAINLVGMGKKGVGVAIVNCYGDDLWKNSLPAKATAFGNLSTEGAVGNPLGGGVYDDGNFGNAGFVDGCNVYPILDIEGYDESSSDDNESEDENGTKEEDVIAETKQLNLSDHRREECAVSSEGAPAATGGIQGDEMNEKVQEEPEPEPDQNDILENAFYASLLLLLSSKIPLPMPVSTYYAKHLLAAVPATGPRLDMKQTAHKKIGSFLREMEADGVIKLGASKDGKDHCAFLSGIVKNNPELIQFKRIWKKEIEASGGQVSMTGASSSQKTKLAVVDLFIVPHHVSELMQLEKDAVMAVNAKTEERKGTGFLTKKECCALIEMYIENEDLIDPKGKGRVLVNGSLCDALYRISKKNKQAGQTNEYPTTVKRKDLILKWIDRMDKGHALVQMPGSKILQLGRGGPKPVEIEVEFRQGNRRKFNTRVRGMEEYGVDGGKLSHDIAHRFACSSSAETDPVGRPALKKGRVELVIQGHLSEEIAALLIGDESLTSHGGVKGSDYSLPKSVISVVLRKGIPARKKLK